VAGGVVDLAKVHGIGAVAAAKHVKAGIQSVGDLRAAVSANTVKLTAPQSIGKHRQKFALFSSPSVELPP
jgi:nucleotidyltransferase/DNA polymerase involved in DNA repair